MKQYTKKYFWCCRDRFEDNSKYTAQAWIFARRILYLTRPKFKSYSLYQIYDRKKRWEKFTFTKLINKYKNRKSKNKLKTKMNKIVKRHFSGWKLFQLFLNLSFGFYNKIPPKMIHTGLVLQTTVPSAKSIITKFITWKTIRSKTFRIYPQNLDCQSTRLYWRIWKRP